MSNDYDLFFCRQCHGYVTEEQCPHWDYEDEDEDE